ncbi:hypothetical protein [Streptomyces roseochromogenus]|uniref:Uncharacterized protein n=1 Tax=Streptomyces roseochromogenus subsp. oscitans DS 12.976 TaxID=1352936 RepID=V6JXR0_STRRC|nr:hypothetical protein [Streptomyces roseochromogenus]EST24493.1 hypothetical protein M878_30470 [Streptomyces roseochromogenus subsp. oscitans DS 12.976]
MRYATITPDGELAHHDDEPDWHALVGPENKARVSLRGLAVTGWVNDVGLLLPERYPRNVIGSCVLASLGAAVQPYAGTIVLTGWNPDNTPRGLLEIEPLPQPVHHLDTVHGDVLKALAGQTPRELSPSWAESMREVAEHVRTAPAPSLTLRPVRLS